jgi:pyridoxal phosphate enzyme (YggS family)
LCINYKNLSKIKDLLEEYEDCELLVVTKNQGQNKVLDLLKENHFLFGENRVQEAFMKFEKLKIKYPKLKLHLIGPLQTNKAKAALNLFDTIQSIDRKKLIDVISSLLKLDHQYETKNFFIQVNIGEEFQKSGVSPEDTKSLYDYAVVRGLKVKGLMCIPPANHKAEIYFQKLFKIKESINKNLKLSMGMSSDYDVAVKEGSNLIRVGSIIFQ